MKPPFGNQAPVHTQTTALALPADRASDGAEEPLAEEPLAAGPSAIFPLVYRQMHALAGGRVSDLDDLVQSAAEQALRALPSFERRSRLSTWTYRICYLTMLKHQRWHRRWLRRFRLSPDGELPEQAAPGPGEIDGPGERGRRLRVAIEKLSPKRRAVVVLHDLEELGVEEIAAIVGANVLTVRSRLRDGRKDLTRMLERDPYFGDESRREDEEEP